MSEPLTITLRAFCIKRYVSILWVSSDVPEGEWTLFGHYDFSNADRFGLLYLEGIVNAKGEWVWNGKPVHYGMPNDGKRNAITSVKAVADETFWRLIAAEWQAGESMSGSAIVR